MPRKRPKSLDTDVARNLWKLEHWAYMRCDQWKRSYRYTLINEFRVHITEAKNAYIQAFDMLARFKREKAVPYSKAYGELSIVESNMDHMIADQFCIMSEKEWAQAAEMIEDIRVGLSRLTSSLTKSVGGSELPIFGEEGVSADYKDA